MNEQAISATEDRRSLVRVLILLTQTYGVTVIGLIIGVFSARGLSVSDRGLLALLLLATQMCSRLGSIGFEQVLLRDGASGRTRAFYLTAITGSLLASPIIYLSLRTSKELLWLVPIMTIVAAAISVLRVNVALLIHTQQLRPLAILNMGQAVSQLLLYGLVFQSHALLNFLWVWITNVLAFSCLSIYLILRNGGNVFYEQPQSWLTRSISIWREGSRFSGIALSEMALSFCLELPVVRLVLGGTQAGLYSISNTLTGVYFQVFVAFSAIAARSRRMVARGMIYTGMFAMAILLALVAGPAISLVFGEKYVGATHFAAVMLPVTWLLGIARIEQTIADQGLPIRYQILLFVLLVLVILLGSRVHQTTLLPVIAFGYATYSLLTLYFLNRRAKQYV